MAALGDMNIKIGADISGLISKVDAAKAKLNQLTEGQQQLKNGITDLNTSLKLNEAELTKTATALNKLVTSGAGATKEAEALRKSMSGLAQNSAQLNKSLSAAKDQLAATTTQLKVQNVALKEAEAGSTGFTKGLTKAYSGLRTLANIIPSIGIGGLVALIAGPVIEAFTEWFNSTGKVSDALKLLQANQANLNDVLKDANKDAGKQTADLKIQYDAATNVNLSMKDRLAAVKGLQTEFPDFFANLSKEAILNGQAKNAYDAATVSIQANARARAALSKIQELSTKILDAEFQKQKIINATTRETAAAQAAAERAATTTQIVAGLGVTASTQQLTKGQILEIIRNRKDLALATEDANIKTLNDQINFLEKFATLPTLAKVVEDNIKVPKGKISKPIKDELKVIDDALTTTFALARTLPKIEDLTKSSLGKISPTEGMAQAIKDLLKGFADADAAQADLQKRLDNTADTVANIVAPAFTEMFKSILDGSKSLGQVLGDLVKRIAEAILKAAALAAIFAFIFPGSTTGKKGFFGAFASLLGFSEGGAVKRFAEGGHIKGPGSKTSDSILARLSAGEYVLKADVVKKIGVPVLDAINKGRFPYSNFNGLPRFANGGFVSSNLSNIINAGQVIFIPSTIIRGQDIVTSFKRASGTINRNG